MGKKGRGRPAESIIRSRMEQIVDALGVTYGYEIYKVYTESFSPVDLRSMYYHLAKGVDLNEFVVVGAKEEKGAFTWGGVSVRKYYILGPAAAQAATGDLYGVIKALKLKHKEPRDYVDWERVLKEKTEEYRVKINLLLRVKKPNPAAVVVLREEIKKVLFWLEGRKTPVKQLRELYEGFLGKIKE